MAGKILKVEQLLVSADTAVTCPKCEHEFSLEGDSASWLRSDATGPDYVERIGSATVSTGVQFTRWLPVQFSLCGTILQSR